MTAVESTAERGAGRRGWRVHLVSLALFGVLAATVISLSAFSEHPISILDESTHADYVHSLRQLDVPRKGESLDPEILGAWACYGFGYEKLPVPDCGTGPYSAEDFPWEGYNYNYFHPPLFYALDAAGSAAIQTVVPGVDFLTSTRLAGAFWLTAGAFGVWLLLCEFAVSTATARSAVALLVFLPAVIHLHAIVNNDSAALVAGSLLALAAARVVRGRSPWWIVPIAAAVAALLKTVFLVAGVLAFLMIADEVIRRHRAGHRYAHLVAAAVLIPIAFGSVQFGWRAIQENRADNVAYTNPLQGRTGEQAVGVPIGELFSELGAFVPVSRPGTDMPEAESPVIQPWITFSSLALAASPIVLLLTAERGGRARRFAGSVQLALMSGGVIVATAFFVNSETHKAALNPRYGLSLLPAVIVCVGILVDGSRLGPRALAGFVGLGAFLMIPALAGWW